MVYALGEPDGGALLARARTRARRMDGVELVCWLERDAHGAPTEAVIAAGGVAELRFAPGGDHADRRGALWSIDGAGAALGLDADADLLEPPEFPDALSRVWAALCCESSGDLVLSAAPGCEFLDWGGQGHVGGGSHGSLRAEDSLTGLILCGCEPLAPEPAQWSIRDVAPIVVGHFGAAKAPPASGPAVSKA